MRCSDPTTFPSGPGPAMTIERVHPPRPAVQSLSHWGQIRPWEAADAVRRDVLGGETTLPLVWLFDGIVAPIVSWRYSALTDRLDTGQGPVLSRAFLGEQLRAGAGHECRPVLSMTGFVAVQPMRRARSVMGWLAGYAAVAAAVPAPPGAHSWDAFECDFHGFTIAEVTAQGAQAAVLGPLTGRGTHLPVDAHQRLLEEQLFDLALSHDALPVSWVGR